MCIGAFPDVSEEAIVRQAKMNKAFKEDVPSRQTRGKGWWDPHIWWGKGGCMTYVELTKSENHQAGYEPRWNGIIAWYFTPTSNEKTQQTTYIMQFMWRDLTLAFDLVGPYYESAGSMKSKIVLACIYDIMKLLHL